MCYGTKFQTFSRTKHSLNILLVQGVEIDPQKNTEWRLKMNFLVMILVLFSLICYGFCIYVIIQLVVMVLLQLEQYQCLRSRTSTSVHINFQTYYDLKISLELYLLTMVSLTVSSIAIKLVVYQIYPTYELFI